MRRNSRESVRASVEQLEGRMLLSVWAGTWNVQGEEMNAEQNGSSGDATYKAMSLTANIKDIAPGQYTMTVSGSGVSETLPLTDNGGGIGMERSDASQNSVTKLELVMVDPGVLLVTHAKIHYGDSTQQTIDSVNCFGGIATQKAPPVLQFAWDGSYTAHDFSLDVSQNNGTYDAQTSSSTMTVTFTPADSGQYAVAVEGDSKLTTFSPSGSKLVYQGAGTDSGGDYKHKYEQIWRGPNGRIYHVGGSAGFNTTTGQLDWASFDATYTDPLINVAPVLYAAGSPAFDAIDEDATDNAGTSVSDLLSRGGSTYIYDANGNSMGIAVVGTDTRHGKWQYSLDGSTWQDVGKVNGSSALLLAGSDRLRFVPSADYNGTLTKAITFRAWDGSDVADHPNGSQASVNASGKMTAFSQASDTASLVVNPVNDAPVISGAGTALSYTAGRSPIAIFKGMTLTDIDSKLLTSATVILSGGFVPGTDVVSYKAPAGITMTPTVANGQLKLEIESTAGTPLKLSTFVAALKSITFKTPAVHAPVAINFAVTDLDASGNGNNLTTAVDRILNIA